MHSLIMSSYIVSDMQQMGDGKLCHRLSAVGRDIGDHDTSLACLLNINHIIACGEHPDIPQFGQLLKNCLIKHHFVGQHHVCILGTLYGERGWRSVILLKLHLLSVRSGDVIPRFPTYITRVGGIAVHFYYLHKVQKFKSSKGSR